MKKRIGFFAGSFDPIHHGHLEVAKSAIIEIGLDELFFMVEESPWSNKNPLDIVHRYKMVDLSIKKESKISRLEIGDKQFNIERTLTELENKYPNRELYFIFGADVFMQMNAHQWPGLEKLFKHTLVVFERGDVVQKHIVEHAKDLGVNPVIIRSNYLNHSSTEVRRTFRSRKLWVPEVVTEYIKMNKLY